MIYRKNVWRKYYNIVCRNISQTGLLDILFPNLCIICENKLVNNEKHLCLACLIDLPFTDHTQNYSVNEAEALFAGRFNFCYAASLSYYIKGGSMQKIIHAIKYYHNTELALYMGIIAGQKFRKSNFLSEIDFLIPVPLHKKRLKERGYNQAEIIANGISKATNIPVLTNNIKRTSYNISQTKKSKTERWTNVNNIFEVVDYKLFKEKHILLIDDVITTGSTIESLVRTVMQEKNIRISIFSISLAI